MTSLSLSSTSYTQSVINVPKKTCLEFASIPLPTPSLAPELALLFITVTGSQPLPLPPASPMPVLLTLALAKVAHHIPPLNLRMVPAACSQLYAL